MFILERLAGSNAFSWIIYSKRVGFLEELNINNLSSG
jgi:hypothetical protein